MNRLWIGPAGLLVVLCAFLTSLSAQVAVSPVAGLDHRALKQELRRGDVGAVWTRLEETAMDESGQALDAFKLCQTFLILQSGDDWKSNRDVLNPMMREVLGGINELYPSDLKAGDRDQGSQLVLMGKLFEKYLYDREEAEACYLKVVNRFLGDRGLPVSAEDWLAAIRLAENSEKLNADERFAFKRLLALRRQEEAIAHRIAYAGEQKALKAKMETTVAPRSPDFNPNDSVPFEAIRKRHMAEGGQK